MFNIQDVIEKALSVRNHLARKANEQLQEEGRISEGLLELLSDEENRVDLSLYGERKGDAAAGSLGSAQ
jgi:hypothetical protein